MKRCRKKTSLTFKCTSSATCLSTNHTGGASSTCQGPAPSMSPSAALSAMPGQRGSCEQAVGLAPYAPLSPPPGSSSANAHGTPGGPAGSRAEGEPNK